MSFVTYTRKLLSNSAAGVYFYFNLNPYLQAGTGCTAMILVSTTVDVTSDSDAIFANDGAAVVEIDCLLMDDGLATVCKVDLASGNEILATMDFD